MIVHPEYLIYTGAIIIFLYIFINTLSFLIAKNKERKYIKYFKNAYKKSPYIKCVLNEILKQYPNQSKQAKVISKALYYLEHSVMRDYKTALSFISDYFNSPKIRKCHKNYIEHERLQRTLLLEKKG